MKVWALQYLAERNQHGIRLFAEDAPPSMERVEEILDEWDASLNLNAKLEALRNGEEYHSYWEWLSLTLMKVEQR